MIKSKREFGFQKLEAQLVGHIQYEFDDLKERESNGDSEIERLFFLALRSIARFNLSAFPEVTLAASAEDESRLMSDYDLYMPILVVRPQAKILNYRVDFLLHTHDRTSPIDPRKLKWRKLVVECDGHDFHERTKEQAAKDRSRDRELTSRGYDVFRFTGSELWTDPISCGFQVHSWAQGTW